MEKLVVVVVLSILTRCAVSQNPCANVTNNPATPKIPLPMLPTNQFKAVVRAEIVNKQMTVEAVEYVDETLNMATLKIIQKGTSNLVIMSYPTNEVFYVGPPPPNDPLPVAGPMFCEAQNMSLSDNTQLFGMGTVAGGSTHQHLYSTSQILNFINGTEVYKGRTTVSGIPVNWWSSCVYWPQLHANFTLDYYFTIPGWQTPSGMDQIPLRAEIQGLTSLPNGTHWNFHHIYQYVNFEKYINDPESIFATPPGVYCLMRKQTRAVPKLNNHFYYREEISNPAGDGIAGVIQETDIWFDSDLQLVRFDRRYMPKGLSTDFQGSQGPFTTIHDYNLGVRYTIAQDMGLCSVDPIPLTAQGFDAVQNMTSNTLGMRSSMQFFNLNRTGYIYVGQRMARGQQCDVFQVVLSSIPGHGVTIYEIYFLSSQASSISDRGQGNGGNSAVPMRIMMWESGQLANQYEIHNFDQDNSLASSFDNSACFTGSNVKDFELFLNVADTNLMPQMAPYVRQLVKLQIAFNNMISPLRLQKSRMHWDQYGHVYFQGSLLGTPPASAKYEVTANQVMSQNLGKAVQNIMSVDACAAQCDTFKAWCVQFNYCPSNHGCVLGRQQTKPTLVNGTGCSYYNRVLGKRFDDEVPLDQVWASLKNMVYGKTFTFDLPLPDASGKVDLNVDTSKLDSTQKLTFTAYSITDQVVSSVNRQASASSMSQFTMISNKAGKGYRAVERGVSVDDCASDCVGELTYNCQSFHYCWDAGTCFLSVLHPDERPDMLRPSPSCDLYYRDYTSNFQQFNGVTLLSSSNAIYENVVTASQCAKLCSYYTPFHCESFDFCTDISACYLGQQHYYDTPRANIKQAPSCVHYSRNYIQDFVTKSQSRVSMANTRVIQAVTAQQCAKLCVQEGSFSCNSFDYCGNFTECRLTIPGGANVGQLTLEATAYCDVYIRQYGQSPATQAPNVTPAPGQTQAPITQRPNTQAPNTQAPNTQSPNTQNQGGNQAQTGSSGYTGGAMGGLAIAMIILGLVIGLGGIMLYNRFFGRNNGGDGMSIAFSKQMDSVSEN